MPKDDEQDPSEKDARKPEDSRREAGGVPYEQDDAEEEDEEAGEKRARGSEPPNPSYEVAKDELFEALDHFRSAATNLLGRMGRDLSKEGRSLAKEPVVK